jgi:hypothetical protein
MPTDNSRFVAGHFIASLYSGPGTVGTSIGTIGTTETGFTLIRENHIEPIKIDEFGDTTVDGIYRGSNLRIRMQGVTYGATAQAVLANFYDTTIGVIGPVGQTIGGQLGRKLVLTPVAGINSNNIQFTFPVTAPDGNSGGFNLNTKNRRTDIDLLVFPLVTITNPGATNETSVGTLFTNP